MALNKGEKLFSVLEYARTSSVVTVELEFRGQFNKESPVCALMRWAPKSPNLTPYDFFSWGFVKDTVFVPPVTVNLKELRDRITATVALIDRDLQTRVWNELDYQLDVCRIGQGGHIEHL